MKFRSARHTSDPEAIKHFYIEVLGLELLGEFQGHDGYDGIFIGRQGLDWHLEFTVSDHDALHRADEDDLLVFYTSSEEEYNAILERAAALSVEAVEPRNPYWKRKGMSYKDPDGFGVVVVAP